MEFLEKQNQSWINDLDQHIAQCLYEDWANEHEKEGEDYLENRLMSFASAEMQKKYNEYYNLTKDDDFYFVHHGDN